MYNSFCVNVENSDIEEAQSILRQYMLSLIEKMMESEIEGHFGYVKHLIAGNNS